MHTIPKEIEKVRLYCYSRDHILWRMPGGNRERLPHLQRTRNNLYPLFPQEPPLLLPKVRQQPGKGMFSSSVRRVATAAPSVSITPSISCAAPRTAALSYRSHQRRLSSSNSKPSSPADGSSAPPATRVSKKKAREVAANSTVKGRDASLLHLPSVPSTQHIPEMRKLIQL